MNYRTLNKYKNRRRYYKCIMILSTFFVNRPRTVSALRRWAGGRRPLPSHTLPHLPTPFTPSSLLEAALTSCAQNSPFFLPPIFNFFPLSFLPPLFSSILLSSILLPRTSTYPPLIPLPITMSAPRLWYMYVYHQWLIFQGLMTWK